MQSCLGLHGKNLRCEVITVWTCSALVSGLMFSLSNHAVGPTAFETFCFRRFVRRVLPFYGIFLFFFMLTLQKNPVQGLSSAVGLNISLMILVLICFSFYTHAMLNSFSFRMAFFFLKEIKLATCCLS